MGRFKNLRTLLISSYNQSFVDVLNEMFKKNRSIRLLCILGRSYNIEFKVIFENIGYLHHLRYLMFSTYGVKMLPRSLSSLYHLQFIIIDQDYNVVHNDYFPRDMNKLSNLRYLRSRHLNFPGIGKLKFLQILENFNIKDENGYKIEELEHMYELGILSIDDLENVRNAEEARNAKLCDKRKLKKLSLNWGNNRHSLGDADRIFEERVLDNLQPHNYLNTFWMFNYMGARSAIWMNEAHTINNLVDIKLFECSEWEILPPFGQLPFLESLLLLDMPKVKQLVNKFHGNDKCSVFPSLLSLYISNLEALVDWFDASVIDASFPCLTELFLYNCPNLQELPYLPPKLETLEIQNVGWKTLNCCSSISKSIRLQTLDVSDCPNITTISLADEIGKLKKLTFKNLPSLQSLPSSLRNASSLQILELENIPQVPELPYLPTSFKGGAMASTS